MSLLHQQDPPIAHRDLKLENFLMAANGVYKLCDFGSCVDGPQSLKTKEDRARELENVDKRTTAMYRSPELADVEGTAMFGAGELTEAVDVWAMGCILYTMAFFKPPFPPDGLRTERYTIPEGSKYSADVHALIKRMLTADVELRATLNHVMECIDEMMEGRPMPPLRKGGGSSGAAKLAATSGAAKTRDSASAAPAATKKTTEARKETVPSSTSTKPAMDLLDMDFQPATTSSTVSKTDSGSAAAWNVAPTDTFANFASFPSPTGGGSSSGGGSSLDGKRMDAFGFPASPVKAQPSPAFGFTPAAAAPPPVAAPPVDPFAELAAPGMGGHFRPGAPIMGGAPGFTPAFQHHAGAPQQQQQQFYGQQPQGFYPPPMQQQQHAAQGFYQPQQQQMWGAQQQQQQQQAFGGANAFNNARF